jgi:hypothetical protein
MDLVPGPFGQVAIACPHCGHANRVSWGIGVGVGLVALLPTIGAAVMLSAWVPDGVVVAAAMVAWLALTQGMMRHYLRHADHPFGISVEPGRRHEPRRKR